jgi:hypothetical protein
MPEIIKAISDTVRFGANLFTFILGGIALWGILFRRKKLALFFKILISSFTNERVKRIKETLGKLESLTFDEKDNRKEIFALLGRVSGQIKPLATDGSGLKEIDKEISDLLAKTIPLTEATKQKIVYELHSRLDNISFVETSKILE